MWGQRLPGRELDLLFERASEKYDEGKFRSAFRLYLAGPIVTASGKPSNAVNITIQ
jgi:hypothetical protein